MKKIDYKEAVLLSCHMNFKSEIMQRTSFEILKLLLDMGSLDHDIFLVESDEAKTQKKTENKDFLQKVDDGIYRVVKIENGLNAFYDRNWIFCFKLTTEAQIRSLIAAERGVHIYNFYGASDRANKLIKNLSKSENNCFFLTNPEDASKYSIIGNDALFRYLVQELPDHKNYAPQRGDTGHWTAKGKFFFPLRLKKEDRIQQIVSSLPTGPNIHANGSAAGAGIVTALAVMCRSTKRCLLRGLPTFIGGRETIASSIHMGLAMFGNGSTSDQTPKFLPFLLNKHEGRRDVKPRIGKKGCPGVGGGILVCDEYPYASTREGGNANYKKGLVSLQWVPKTEGSRQGVLLKKFYKKAKVLDFSPGSLFLNVSLPTYETAYIDRATGKWHRL